MKVIKNINYLKENTSANNLILNSSIIILIIINVLLVHSLIKNISGTFNDSDNLTETDKSKPRIQVEVLNGCGISGTAEIITEHLRSIGFDVVNLSNYRSFEIDNSIIITRNDKMKNAEKFAAAVGLDKSSIIQQTHPDYLLDITFVLGKDYNNLIPLNKRLH